MAKKQFRDNDTSGESQSHREDDGARPMWAGFPSATCEDILIDEWRNCMEKVKKEQTINVKMNTIMALALVKNLFLKGEISETVYKNICKDYQKVVEK